MCKCLRTGIEIWVRTFGRQVEDEKTEWGEEHARSDDVDDVEERLSLDDKEENHLLVFPLILTVLSVYQLLRWPVFDDPLPIFWQWRTFLPIMFIRDNKLREGYGVFVMGILYQWKLLGRYPPTPACGCLPPWEPFQSRWRCTSESWMQK